MSRNPKRNSTQPPSRVSVARARGDFRVVASESIAEGERILHFQGELVEHPTRETLQIDTLRHLAVPKGLGVERVLDEYAWRFLNHSCDANGVVRHRELVARRPIGAGQVNPIGVDAVNDSGQIRKSLLRIVQPLDQHHLQEEPPPVFSAEGFQTCDMLVKGDSGVGAIDALEKVGCAGIQRWEDCVGREQLPPYLGVGEK